MPANADYLLWIPLAPLIGAFISGTMGKRLGRNYVQLVACGSVFFAFMLSAGAFAQIWGGATLALPGSWFQVGHFHIGAGLQVDRLSAVLLLIVTGIGFLIHVYSTDYMAEEPGYWRYFAYLNLFVGAMLILVLADNLVLLFVGWEGVGLCSYLLIGFWYDDDAKASAGKKAFIVNRVGDFGFGLGVFATLALLGTVDFGAIQGALTINHGTDLLRQGLFSGWQLQSAITLIALFFVVGVTGKSAQIPLYIWLPDAMAGPTPVSALIHAATMVTAGVYLMCRLSLLFAFSPVAMLVVACLGAGTALFAALIAFAQNDIKKVLAYSTISQLGFMVLAVGVGAFWAAIFHLVTHACFKALLFLGSGSVIHGMQGEQDMRRMGGLGKKLPHTALAFAVGTVAITGVLPFSGFFSKDAILGLTLGTANHAFPWAPWVLYLAGSAAALGTAFYMWRLWALTFMGKPRSEAAEHAHESPAAMTVVDDTLALLSIGALALGLPLAGGAPLERFLAPVFAPALRALPALVPPKDEGIPWATYAVALAIAWLGFGLARWLYQGGGQAIPARLETAFPFGYRLVANKFYVDELYDTVIVRPLWTLARWLWRLLDGSIDILLTTLPAWLVRVIATHILRPLQNGDTQRYATAMALGFATLLWLVLR
jgi:NADH-quinone oxidoreductase subunit L